MLSEENIYLILVLFTILEFFWEFYLDLRQNLVYAKNREIPVEFIGILSKKTFDQARSYAIDKSNFNLVMSAFSFTCNLAYLYISGFKIFWNFAGKLTMFLGWSQSEMIQSIMFVLVLNFIRTYINFPFRVYYNFVLEKKHGFNNQTFLFFINDTIKKHIVEQLVAVMLVAGITYFSIEGYFFIKLWIYVTCATLFLYTIYPEYIAPLFDKYTPLPEGELKNEIEKLAASVNFPLYKLYVVEGSKRSAHSNAFFYGLFKYKRVVLFDTLLKDYTFENAKEKEDEKAKERQEKGCDTNEVLAVLAHELGHWKLNHIVKNLIFAQLNLLVVFFTFWKLLNYQPLYAAFGFDDSRPVLIGLILVSAYVCLPYYQVVSFFIATLSRHFEFQADNFAKSLGRTHHLKSALIKLNRDNLGFPIYDPLYSKWHHSHPPLLERLQALDKDE